MKTNYYAHLESLIEGMKDYQYLKKKLKNRRLDYDARHNKIQKSKKEKPEQEEEMKVAQAKYERTLEQIQDLMKSFAEREEQLLDSLACYAEAELVFFKKSAESLEKTLKIINARFLFFKLDPEMPEFQ